MLGRAGVGGNRANQGGACVPLHISDFHFNTAPTLSCSEAATHSHTQRHTQQASYIIQYFFFFFACASTYMVHTHTHTLQVIHICHAVLYVLMRIWLYWRERERKRERERARESEQDWWLGKWSVSLYVIWRNKASWSVRNHFSCLNLTNVKQRSLNGDLLSVVVIC